MGSLNANVSESTLPSFCTLLKIKNLVKEPTCYKKLANPSRIDLFLTNRAISFHRTCVFETGLPHFHKLVLTILRSKYKQFDKEKFKTVSQNYLNEVNSNDLSVDVSKMFF